MPDARSDKPPQEDRRDTPTDESSERKGLGLAGWGTVAGILASVATVAAFVVGLGGGGDDTQSSSASTTTSAEDPVKALARESLEDFHSADYAAYWELFHPGIQEQVIPEDKFVECQTQAGAPAGLKSLQYRGLGGVDVDMEGVSATHAKLVLFKATLITPNGTVTAPENVTVDDSSPEPYLLPPTYEYDAYIAGKCPPVQNVEEPGPPGDDVTP